MSLVDPTRPDGLASPTARAASQTTVVVSLAAHVIVVALVVVVPLLGHAQLPPPAQRIGTFVKAAAYERVEDATMPSRAATSPRRATASARPVPGGPAEPAPAAAPTGIADGEAPPMSRVGGVGGSLGAADGSALFGFRPAVGEPPPPPPVPTPRTVRMGGSIQPPRKLRHVAPIYPQIAQQARVTGTVILEAVLSPGGEVGDVRVLRSVPLLDAAAIDAVRQWQYAPTLLNGTPVSVVMTITVRFEQ